MSVRNLSTNGHALVYLVMNMTVAKDRGWSEPMMSSWIPIAGEILVATSIGSRFHIVWVL